MTEIPEHLRRRAQARRAREVEALLMKHYTDIVEPIERAAELRKRMNWVEVQPNDVTRICDAMHEANTTGLHQQGWCRACAEIYEAINRYIVRSAPEQHDDQHDDQDHDQKATADIHASGVAPGATWSVYESKPT